MARTGSALVIVLALVCAVGSARAEDEIVFNQSVDRAQLGVEDTLRLTVTTENAPRNARLELPAPEDFEVLSRSQSTQTAVQLGTGGADIRRITRYTLILRPLKTGKLLIPPATLSMGKETLRTETLAIDVKPGSLGPPPGSRQRPRRPDPFAGLPLPPGFGTFDDPFDTPDLGTEMDVPRSESDLFLRMDVVPNEVYVGEQATLSLYVYSRVDLSSVESVVMPKLEGFWGEDIEPPSQLVAEQQIINGVPYRRYLLRKKALFPVRAGNTQLDPAEADITAGFLFAGHRVHRKSNEVEMKVKPLPAGAPAGFSTTSVGRWRLSVELDKTEVAIGETVTARLTLEGVGNFRNVSPPGLSLPSGLRAYEPTLTDTPLARGAKQGGRRVLEYLIKPERTGEFVIPSVELPYFDPEAQRYEVARTQPVKLRVTGAEGRSVATSGGPGSGSGRNVLAEGAPQPLRARAEFRSESTQPWQTPWFQALAVAPVLAAAGLLAGGRARRWLKRQDVSPGNRYQSEVQARLSAAAALSRGGSTEEFSGEVERALYRALEQRLGGPAMGLTRDALETRLTQAGVPEDARGRIRALLERCELGRYAPSVDEGGRTETLRMAERVISELTS